MDTNRQPDVIEAIVCNCKFKSGLQIGLGEPSNRELVSNIYRWGALVNQRTNGSFIRCVQCIGANAFGSQDVADRLQKLGVGLDLGLGIRVDTDLLMIRQRAAADRIETTVRFGTQRTSGKDKMNRSDARAFHHGGRFLHLRFANSVALV